MVYKKRIDNVQRILEELNIDAVIAASPSNFFYFSGTWLDSHERLQAIVIPRTGNPTMIVHEMSKEQIHLIDHFETIFWKDGDSSLALLTKYLPDRGTISIDNQWTSHNLIQLIELNKHVSFMDSTKVIGTSRLYKDDQEIDLLKTSAAIADKVMNQIIDFIKPGLTEKAIVEEIKRLFVVHKAELSPNTIVGTGRNSAIPHHLPDETPIAAGDMVVIDMGGTKNHYWFDITRSVVVRGKASEEMQKVYEIVKHAQDIAINAIRPGIPLKEIDRIARDIIRVAGYGPYFTHRTGHGIGIEVHEEPYVNSKNHQLLEEGMVISIEPGIYLSGKFGVRIEDIVVVTSNGCERLNHVPRDLIYTGNKNA